MQKKRIIEGLQNTECKVGFLNDQRKHFIFHITLTIVRLRLPIVLSVSEREGGVGTAREAGALLGLQAAHPHVLQAVIRRGVHLGLRVHV